MSEKAAKVIETERFVLRDSQGRVRAELGEGTQHAVALKPFDEHQRCRVEVVVAADGTAGIQFWDEGGLPRVILALDPDKPYIAAPSLSLTGRDGQSGVVLSVAPDGTPSISFLKDGAPFCELPGQEEKPSEE